MVVDDDPLVRSAAAGFLRAQGYRVTESGGGLDAIERLQRHSVDLLLTDVLMPDVDGGAVSRFAIDNGSAARIVYMTGYAGRVLGRHHLPHGATLLRKPFTEEELLAAVRATDGDPIAGAHELSRAGRS